MEIKNKIAWIIGASSGIGAELCKQLSNQGATVILSARNIEKLNRIKLELKNADSHLVLAYDVEDTRNLKECVDKIISQYGRIDFLFLNAGISQRGVAGETEIEVDRKIMEVNYFGNIAVAKAVLPVFQNQKSGKIVVTSSIAGKFGFYLRSAYSASKHALHGFFESLALEEAKNNISVLMLVPGKINTEISKSALDSKGKKHNEMDHNQDTGMPVEKCVQKIIEGIEKEKVELLIGGKEIKVVWIKRFFPKLFRKIIKKQKAT